VDDRANKVVVAEAFEDDLDVLLQQARLGKVLGLAAKGLDLVGLVGDVLPVRGGLDARELQGDRLERGQEDHLHRRPIAHALDDGVHDLAFVGIKVRLGVAIEGLLDVLHGLCTWAVRKGFDHSKGGGVPQGTAKRCPPGWPWRAPLPGSSARGRP